MGTAIAANSVLGQTALGQGAGAPIPTAVIGTGNRRSYLLRGVMEQTNTKVAALCDIKPDRLDKAASSAAKDSPKTYRDWRQVLDRKDVEAVFIATPPHLHAEMAIAALEAGKHVYCEKPVGVTPRQVQDLIIAAQASKKVLVSGQQLRSYKQFSEAVGKIRAGVIGQVAMVKAQRHASGDLPYDYLLVEQGVHIGEFHNLEALAANKVNRFVYIATTNRLKGAAAGTAMRPIAIE